MIKETKANTNLILVSGDDSLAWSITVCLLMAGHEVVLHTNNEEKALAEIFQHADDLMTHAGRTINRSCLVTSSRMIQKDYELAIIIRQENLDSKLEAIKEVELIVPKNAVIATNIESFSLREIQDHSSLPGRIIGLNWVEPAHTSFFLEIISNYLTEKGLVDQLYCIAKKSWRKDPYIAACGYSIRTIMMSALIREAFYLVENGYVSFEDVDRACRNDAGYYLPFAGNFRYMDLMGTYKYGLVMKDLNPDLSDDWYLPSFFRDLVAKGCTGMEVGEGFFNYQNGQVEKWKELSRLFSYQIGDIISKYPFNEIHKDLSEHETSSVL